MWGDQVSCIEGYSQITSCVDPLDWLREVGYWSGLDEAPSGMREDNRGALRDFNVNYPSTQPPFKVLEVWLHVAERGYDGRVV